MSEPEPRPLLGATRIRELAAELDLRPTKQWGQNFVVDANTVRRIVRLAGVTDQDQVLEVGPGLGSLTVALLEVAAGVTAIEIDPALAARLPQTAAEVSDVAAQRLTLVAADALTVTDLPGPAPTLLVANLPYNVSVPVVLTLLERFGTLRGGLVMVQQEVAERLAADPGTKAYGVPSLKVAWYATASLAGSVPRGVFWPVPNVDSGLVRLVAQPPPTTTARRQEVFACVDAAFAQRRKTLRAALAGWAGSAAEAERILRAAGVEPRLRGEQLCIDQFAAIAAARTTTAAG